ncbi:MAG: beta-L-arabinofuranosidase domain-containing protein [Tepidisphaerales bacterium]
MPPAYWAPLAVSLAVFAIVPAALAADELTPLDIRQVKVSGEIGRRIDVTVHNNLLVLNADKDFLPPFLDKKARDGYIGLGKLIDTAVRLAAYTGDDKVLALKKHLVDKTIAAQEPDGYIGMFAPQHRVSGMWDIHEVGYLIWGLLNDYDFFGEKRSLEAAQKAADYLLANWSRLPPDWGKKGDVATHVAVTGLERTMLALHRVTGEQRYLDFCLNQRTLADWDLPIVIGRRPLIEGHIYAYMARCLAQLELYRIQPDDRLLAQTNRALDFMTRRNGLAITGGTGQWEIWTDDQDGRGELAETCATAYQLRVYYSMLRLKGSSQFGDLMERTIFNTLFAAQSPDGRKLRYFAPTEGSRVYFDGDTYCCPCNYRRAIAELPGMIYYRGQGGITVNLYAASEAKSDLKPGLSVGVKQATDYPNSGRVTLKLDPSQPAAFALRLRIPAWATKAQASINGKPLDQPIAPGSFLKIEREWKSGDAVTLDLPMDFRLVRGRQRQAGRVAVMRGPQVFCLNPAQNPTLAKQDAADLSRLTIDPASLTLAPSDAVRPGGVACKLKAWKSSFDIGPKADYDLTFTEFPDPAGKATYFRLRNPAVGVDDELLYDKP